MRRALLLAWVAMACRGAPPVEQRVLFIGNSYTGANDLAGTVQAMAKARNHIIAVRTLSPGGWTLAEHAEATETIAAIRAQQWTAVVLQEQSIVPAVNRSRRSQMFPAVRELAAMVQARKARLLLFDTWGHRDGAPEFGLPDYPTMQAAIDSAYAEIGDEVRATIVPVGAAWLASRSALPTLDFWMPDGSHPTREGTYLAACLFFGTLFDESPIGLPTLQGIDPGTASVLQEVAVDALKAERQRAKP